MESIILDGYVSQPLTIAQNRVTGAWFVVIRIGFEDREDTLRKAHDFAGHRYGLQDIQGVDTLRWGE